MNQKENIKSLELKRAGLQNTELRLLSEKQLFERNPIILKYKYLLEQLQQTKNDITLLDEEIFWKKIEDCDHILVEHYGMDYPENDTIYLTCIGCGLTTTYFEEFYPDSFATKMNQMWQKMGKEYRLQGKSISNGTLSFEEFVRLQEFYQMAKIETKSNDREVLLKRIYALQKSKNKQKEKSNYSLFIFFVQIHFF